MVLQEERNQASITFKNIKLIFVLRSATIENKVPVVTFTKSRVSKLYKGKGHITTEPTSFSGLQNQQIPEVKTGLTNPCNNIGRPLSDSRQLTTSSPTQ